MPESFSISELPQIPGESREEHEERWEVAYQVERGWLSPAEAEAWAEAKARPPFAISRTSPQQILGEMLWSIHQVIFWISWRSAVDTAFQIAEHEFWSGYIWRNPKREGQHKDLSGAEMELRSTLLKGSVNVFAITCFDSDILARGQRQQITPREWVGLEWSRAPNDKFLTDHEGKPIYADGFLFRDEVTAIWPADYQLPNKENEDSNGLPDLAKGAGGGRPEKYDNQLFLIEAFRILYDGKKQFRDRAEFRKACLDAYYEKTERLPSESWAKPIVKRLWDALDLGGRNSP